jgi:hypothetical protein
MVYGLRLSGRDISIYHNVPNNDMAFHTNWSSTTSGSILLCTRATARLTIDGPTGNVGIGTTNTISRLTIKSDYSNENTGICINEQDANTYNF